MMRFLPDDSRREISILCEKCVGCRSRITYIQTQSFLPFHRTQRNVQILWSSDSVQQSNGDTAVVSAAAAGGVGTQGVAGVSCVVTTDSRQRRQSALPRAL